MSNIDKQALRDEVQEWKDIYCEPADAENLQFFLGVEALLDDLEAKDKRIAEQRETLLAARSHVMQCARLGDAHANGVLQAIDRAAAGKGEAL